jgi:hypothetical protein
MLSQTFIKPSAHTTGQERKTNEMSGKNKYGYSYKGIYQTKIKSEVLGSHDGT